TRGTATGPRRRLPLRRGTTRLLPPRRGTTSLLPPRHGTTRLLPPRRGTTHLPRRGTGRRARRTHPRGTLSASRRPPRGARPARGGGGAEGGGAPPPAAERFEPYVPPPRTPADHNGSNGHHPPEPAPSADLPIPSGQELDPLSDGPIDSSAEVGTPLADAS